jgi:lambda family phage portal protein
MLGPLQPVVAATLKPSVTIFGPDGYVVPPRDIARTRARALMGESGVPYDAADYRSRELGGWNAWLGSPDQETTPYRDTVVARSRDMVRNDGWASGAVTTILDNVVGSDLRLVSKPNHKWLKYNTNSAFDHVWADEFGKAVEANWQAYADDAGKWCDFSRNNTMGQIFRLAYRQKLIDGESLVVMQYDPERRGSGRGLYSTCVALMDADQLSNPMTIPNELNLRGGVEIDARGAAVAYHIRRAHPGEWYDGAKAYIWDRFERETEYGRPVVIHDFDQDRPGQHRPVGGIFTPVITRLKMLIKYDGVELENAIVNAIFGAYITSPADPDTLQGAFTEDQQSPYQEQRLEYHEHNRIDLGGRVMPTLFPGESINAISVNRPGAAFEAFQATMLRSVASALNISYEQLTRDYSRVNYSSARASALETWKTMLRRRRDFTAGTCAQIAGCVIEEMFESNNLPLPAGAPDFMDARTAYASCSWNGPARGWIDPVKERQGALMSLDGGMSTLEQEAAEQGLRWEDNLEQRAVEQARAQELGLKPLGWMVDPNAQDASLKPEKPLEQ